MSRLTLVGFVLLVTATLCGCQGSKADRAMKTILDFNQKTQKLEAEAADGGISDASKKEMLELMIGAIQATVTLQEEVKKMTPARREAFMEKWEKQFQAAQLPFDSKAWDGSTAPDDAKTK